MLWNLNRIYALDSRFFRAIRWCVNTYLYHLLAAFRYLFEVNKWSRASQKSNRVLPFLNRFIIPHRRSFSLIIIEITNAETNDSSNWNSNIPIIDMIETKFKEWTSQLLRILRSRFIRRRDTQLFNLTTKYRDISSIVQKVAARMSTRELQAAARLFLSPKRVCLYTYMLNTYTII